MGCQLSDVLRQLSDIFNLTWFKYIPHCHDWNNLYQKNINSPRLESKCKINIVIVQMSNTRRQKWKVYQGLSNVFPPIFRA